MEFICMELYDLQITMEELEDGSDYRYIAGSPDLPNLIVVGDTIDEVLTLAPQVAATLIASMKAAGDPLPDSLTLVPSLPVASRLMVAA
jgi:predicted RNase H-like HicB family nuclease